MMPKTQTHAFVIAIALLCISVPSVSAQITTCRASASGDGTLIGRCVQGDTILGDLTFQRPSSGAKHLWLGTIRGSRFRSAASSGPTGESEIAVDIRPDGALRLGRSWLE